MSEEHSSPSSENGSTLYMRISRMLESIHSPARENGESVGHFLRRVLINKRASTVHLKRSSILTDLAMASS